MRVRGRKLFSRKVARTTSHRIFLCYAVISAVTTSEAVRISSPWGRHSINRKSELCGKKSLGELPSGSINVPLATPIHITNGNSIDTPPASWGSSLARGANSLNLVPRLSITRGIRLSFRRSALGP